MISTITGLLIFIIFCVPGLTAIWIIKRFLPGPRLSAPNFLIWANFWSVALYTGLTYVYPEELVKALILLQTDANKIVPQDVKHLALVAIISMAVSLILGYVMGRLAMAKWWNVFTAWLGMLGGTAAWDWLLYARTGWVQIRTKSGVYIGHMHLADQSGEKDGGIILRRNPYPTGKIEPIRFVRKQDDEYDEALWVDLPHQWVYIPVSQIEALWAVPEGK